MPLDPRSLSTIYNALNPSNPVQVPTAQSMVNDFTDYVSDKTQALVDRGKDAISNVLTGVGKVVDKYAPSLLAGMATAQFRGTQGSFLSFTYPIRLQYRYFTIAPDRSSEIGYPEHRYKQLSTLSGFCLCENARVPLAGKSLTEQKAVEEFLNSGVYLQ